MPALDRNVKVTCENCDMQITKLNFARHKNSCSAGTLYCTQCPNFSTKSRDDSSYHIAKQHSAAGPSITYKCKVCRAKIPGFYALRQHKNISMEHKLGLERAILMRMTLWEMLTIKVWEKSYSRVDINWLILKNKKGDIVCSILLSTKLQLRLTKKIGSRSGYTEVCSEA